MNIAQSKSGIYQAADLEGKGESFSLKALKILLSLIPWVIVGGLLWAGFFIKPHVYVKDIATPPIEKRDHMYGISAVTSKQIWLAGSYGKILLSEDSGKNWGRQNSGTKLNLQDISAWDAQHAVTVGNSGIVLITDNRGKDWVEINVPKSEIANKLIRVHTYKNGVAWAVGEMGMILRTKDYGKSWTRMREEEDVGMYDVIAVTRDKIFVVAEFGRLFKSDDGGKTWEDTQTESPGSLMAIDFRSPEDGVAVGLDGVILTTVDSGKTWTSIENSVSGNREHLMDVQWSAPTKSWLAVGNKGVYVKFSGNLKNFHSGELSKTELLTHTELAVVDNGFYTVGANVGFIDFKTNKYIDLE